MDFLFGLVLGLSFWHVVWIFLFMGCGIMSSQSESVMGFILTFILFVLGLQFVAGVDIWSNAIGAPFTLFLLLIGYLAIGGIYAMYYSWPKYLHSHSKKIQDGFEAYQNRTVLGTLSEKLSGEIPRPKPTIDDFLNSWDYEKYWSARHNIERNTAYIANWFFDVVWRILSEPLVWIWDTAYKIFANGFARVGIKTTKDILNAPTSK